MPISNRDAPISWRPPKALREKIEALSKERGQALSKVINDLVERGLLVATGTTAATKPDKPPKDASNGKKGKARTDYCPHRRKPEEFCPRCDA